VRLLVATVLWATLSVFLAFRPEHASSPAFFWYLLGGQVPLAALAVIRLHQRGLLRAQLLPRGGDVALGTLIGATLLVGSWFARAAIAPGGAESNPWLLRLFWQIGDPEVLQRSVLYTLALLFLPLTEELIWRGMVLQELNEKLGTRLAWPACAALYAASHLPTLVLLSDPVAGPNPLVVLAALGAGLVWSFAAGQLKRLPPVIVSHMIFTYFSVVQFRIPGL
jgi:membrane protease YdiL (CAAX protease family)